MQINMVMEEMLFINWAVRPEALRKMIHERLEPDTRLDAGGREIGLVSAVCFRVSEVRSSALPIPRLSFEQVNYRAYVRAGEVPAVQFFDMKVNSRMVTALTGFLGAPVHYEDIDITTVQAGAERPGNTSLRYAIRSNGLQAEALIGEQHAGAIADTAITPGFITQRLVGYANAGGGLFRIDVEHSELDAIPARVESVEAPWLEQTGLLTADESTKPHSAFYARDALFGANAPTRE